MRRNFNERLVAFWKRFFSCYEAMNFFFLSFFPNFGCYIGFFLTDFFFLYKQGKDNRERILIRRYLEIVIRLSNIGTKLDNNE